MPLCLCACVPVLSCASLLCVAEHVAGDFGLTLLKPSDEAGLKAMQTKELNNGRLAMVAIAGMVGQELATGARLF